MARQELIQKPHIMTACWKSLLSMVISDNSFCNKAFVAALYEKVIPTNRKLLNLLRAHPKDDSEREALSYLKRYIKGVNEQDLKKVLQFLTGADIVIVEKIDVMFIKPKSDFSRRPIPHTCGPCLELPSTYKNFCELREEFTNIIQRSSWEFDIA